MKQCKNSLAAGVTEFAFVVMLLTVNWPFENTTTATVVIPASPMAHCFRPKTKDLEDNK